MDNDRKLFEDWHQTNWQSPVDFTIGYNAMYVSEHIQDQWEAWQASEAISVKRIAELEAQIKQLHTGDNLKALVDDDTNSLMQTALEMDKTIKEKDKQIKALRDALIKAEELIMELDFPKSAIPIIKEIQQALATTDKE